MKEKEYSEKDWEVIHGYEWYVSRALWCEVIPSLRKVRMEWDPKEKIVWILFYHDGEITEAIDDHYHYINSEANCDDMGIDVKTRIKIIRADYPTPLPKERFVIYARKEPFVDPK